jgi:hypothetical protein
MPPGWGAFFYVYKEFAGTMSLHHLKFGTFSVIHNQEKESAF